MSIDKIKEKRYDAFICYETDSGCDLALHLKKGLKKYNVNSFVAYKDVPPGEDEEKVRFNVIKKSRDFIFIVTDLALKSEEVKKESMSV